MSVIQNNLLLAGDDAYNLQRSLRFRSSASAYLSRTPASAGNRNTWTMSFWMKLGNSSGSIFGGASASNNPRMQFYYTASTGTLEWYQSDSGGGTVFYLIPNQVFRDPSSWYHIVVVADTTQATSSNRLRYFVNGVQVTSFSTATYPSQNTNTEWNTNTIHNIGRQPNGGSNWDGYLTEINFIDGQALTPSSFGENNAQTGVWQPKRYTGTYGTNGFYLPFTNNSTTTTLGNDFSGNGNNWTTNNISLTAGSTYDSMTDVPTLTSATQANYCVMNPLDTQPVLSITNANLTSTYASGEYTASGRGTISVSSGKWYWETTLSTIGTGAVGITGIDYTLAQTADNRAYNSATTYAFYNGGSTPFKLNGGTQTSYGTSVSNGDVIGVAVDLDGGSITFYRNGTTMGVAYTGISGTFAPLDMVYSGAVHNTNFGQRPFAYTPPTGFVALNTFNLPTPTIGATASTQANKYFDISLYSGNNSTQTVTNSGSMQPDMVWIKSRNVGGSNHVVTDSVRGVNRFVIPNLTDSEYNIANTLTSFNSNGFSLGNTAYDFNISGNNYVGWQWRAANGNNVTNTAGSITSTVSANTSSGFSIVTYTGTGSVSTVGHGLGDAPRMIIVKRRDSATNGDWFTYTATTGNGNVLFLNLTNASSASGGAWNNTSPTSSVFTVGTSSGVNANGSTYVAYCFSAVAGYSAFGSYVGNGSADGSFIHVGFKPRFIMIKNTSTSGNGWMIHDTARNTYNVSNLYLQAESSGAEATTSGNMIDILSNGFKCRGTDTVTNANGSTYVYACFAEHPFKYSLGR